MGGSEDVTMTGGAQVGDLNRRREGKPCQAQDTILSILKQTMRHKTVETIAQFSLDRAGSCCLITLTNCF